MLNRGPYIDVRGPHPIFIDGMRTIELRNFSRTISVEVIQTLLEYDPSLVTFLGTGTLNLRDIHEFHEGEA